jgi:hypothetical protein
VAQDTTGSNIPGTNPGNGTGTGGGTGGGNGGGTPVVPGGGGNGGTPPATTIVVDRLTGAANFVRAGRDYMYVTTELSGLPQNLTINGAQVTVAVGGAPVTFTLDQNGRGKSSAGAIRVSTKASANGTRTLTMKAKGSYASTWAASGVKPATGLVPLQMKVDVDVNGTAFTATAPVKYVSKNAKVGKFRK